MKEGGGEQNKQVGEIIDFIRFTEENQNYHYITFMDGIYFNNYSKETPDSPKIIKQRMDIIQNLKKAKNNFFVNTYGLIEILKDLKKSN